MCFVHQNQLERTWVIFLYAVLRDYALHRCNSDIRGTACMRLSQLNLDVFIWVREGAMTICLIYQFLSMGQYQGLVCGAISRGTRSISCVNTTWQIISRYL